MSAFVFLNNNIFLLVCIYLSLELKKSKKYSAEQQLTDRQCSTKRLTIIMRLTELDLFTKKQESITAVRLLYFFSTKTTRNPSL